MKIEETERVSLKAGIGERLGPSGDVPFSRSNISPAQSELSERKTRDESAEAAVSGEKGLKVFRRPLLMSL